VESPSLGVGREVPNKEDRGIHGAKIPRNQKKYYEENRTDVSDRGYIEETLKNRQGPRHKVEVGQKDRRGTVRRERGGGGGKRKERNIDNFNNGGGTEGHFQVKLYSYEARRRSQKRSKKEENVAHGNKPGRRLHSYHSGSTRSSGSVLELGILDYWN